MAQNVFDQILEGGKVHRGQLGVSIQPMTPELASKFGLSDFQGVLVNSVIPNGPAAKAGLRQGDVIVDFNGAAVTDGNTLRNHVASTAPGTKVNLGIFRDHQKQQIQVTLGEYQPKA